MTQCPVCLAALKGGEHSCPQCASHLRVHKVLNKIKHVMEESNTPRKPNERLESGPMTGIKTAIKYFYFCVILAGITLVNLHLYEISKQLSRPPLQPAQEDEAHKTDTLVIMKLVDILSVQTQDNKMMKDQMSDLDGKMTELSEKINKLADETAALNLKNRNQSSKRHEQAAR